MSIYESLLRSLNEAVEYEKGHISLRTNQISIADPEEFSASDIRNIRHATGLSQATFAAAMGVSKKTVEAWECGRNVPAGAAKRLLTFVEDNPKFFEENSIVSFGEMCEKKNAIAMSTTKSEQTVVVTIGARYVSPFKPALAEG